MQIKRFILFLLLIVFQSTYILNAQQWNLKTTTFPSCYTQSNGFCVINNKLYVGVGTNYLEIIGKGQIIPSDFNTCLGKHDLNINNWHSIADQAKNNISPLGTPSQCPNKTIQD